MVIAIRKRWRHIFLFSKASMMFMISSSNASLKQYSPSGFAPPVITALMGAVPFLLSLFPANYQSNLIAHFYLEWLAVALGLMASYWLLRPRYWRPISFPVIALVPIGLLLLLGLQVSFGLMAYWQQHFLIGLYLCWAALMVMLGVALRRDFGLEAVTPLLAWTFLVAGICYALSYSFSVVYQTAANVPLIMFTRVSYYLAVALAALLYLIASQRIKLWIAFVCGSLLLFALALTNNLTGWSYVGLLVLGALLLTKSKTTRIWSALGLVFIFAAWGWLTPMLGIEATHRVAALPTFNQSWQLIQEAWQIFTAHPLLGAGWGQFGWQDFLLAEIYPNHTGWIQHPNNLILHLLAETGLVGASIVVVGLLCWVKGACCDLLATEWLVGVERRYLWLLFGLLSVEVILSNALSEAHLLGLFALLLGLLETRILNKTIAYGHVALGVLVLLGALIMVGMFGHYRTIQHWYAQTQFKNISPQQADPLLQQMGALRHKSLLTPSIDLAIIRALPNRPDLVADKLSLSTPLMQAAPRAQEVYNQAALLALTGQAAQAEQQLQLALIRHPDYLYDFTMQLLANQTKAIVPLLQIIAQHNRDYLEAQKIKRNKAQLK